MPAKPTAAPRPGYPPSPCTRVCTLDSNDVCVGCSRTLDEIVAWAAMSAEEQWSVVRDLPRRKE